MGLLDKDEDEILAEIERGSLGWVWDIRTESATTRRELRVWRDSVLQYLQGIPPRASGNALAVIDTFLPHREVRTKELKRWFSCSHFHICNLIREGSLSLAGKWPEQSSVNEYMRITRASVVAFLQARRIH